MLEINKDFGYSLLEILIALSILSFSLLGFAQAQLLSLRNNHIAYQQSLARASVMSLAETAQACAAISCSAHTLQHAVVVWNRGNAQALPGGKGQLTQHTDYAQIRLTWLSNLAWSARLAKSHSMTTNLIIPSQHVKE